MSRERLRVYYWSQDLALRNLGDVLIEQILDALGYDIVLPQHTLRSATVPANGDRVMVANGSLFVSWVLQHDQNYDFWGTGWKGEEIDRVYLANHERVRVHAVRGPRTAEHLGLSSEIPMGDPVLLLPYLYPVVRGMHGRTVLAPHYRDIERPDFAARRARADCEDALSTWVWPRRFRDAVLHGRWRELLRQIVRHARVSVPIKSVWSVIDRIRGAEFVLTGSLHGAILAQAYGVPWAPYADGYIDFVTKWEDWAAYLGVHLEFANTVSEGRAWWQAHGRHGRIRSLQPLVRAFPYSIPSAQARERLARVP